MNEREYKYLELLRIIAVVLVIFNHIDINYFYYHNTNNIVTFAVSVLVTVVVRINIPIFLMISGSLLLKKEESIRDIFVKRISRIFLATIVFSVVQYIVRISTGKIENASFFDFCRRFIEGDIQETYWFLYMYIGVLLILPFLRKIAHSINKQEFYLLLILKIAVDLLTILFPYITGMNISSNLMAPVRGLLEGGFYIICGYYLDNQYRISHKSVMAGIAGIIIGILVPFLFVCTHFLLSRNINDYIIGTTTPIMALGVFIVTKYYWNTPPHSQVFSRFLTEAGRCVFGIYLVEQLIRVLFYDTYIFLINHTFGIFASVVYAAETFIASLLVIFFFRRIPFLRKIF